MKRRILLSLCIAIAAVLPSLPLLAGAQEATPVAAVPADDLTVVADGLTNPRGMIWGADGTLFVALAGTGGDTPGVPETPPPLGPFMGGPTASVVLIQEGCPVAIADGLPSTRDAVEGVLGAAGLAILGEQLYVLIAGGTEALGNPGTTNGVYQVNADGTTFLLADTSAWLAANPPEEAGWTAPPEGYPNSGNPFALIADEVSGLLWVVDALNGLVLTVALDGTVNLAVNLSDEHPVPTGITLAPEGGLYIGNLTPIPYPDGAAKVVHVAPDGTVTDAWTGLTAVVGLAVGLDGALYALEMTTDNPEEPPFVTPGSGRLVRQTGPDSLEEVVTGLMFPIAVGVGPDGAFYIALPAMGADDGSGQIVRVPLAGEEAAPAAAPECPRPAAATPEAAPAEPDAEVATPEA